MATSTAAPSEDNDAPSFRPDASNPTAGHGLDVRKHAAQSTIFDLPGVTGTTQARDACDAHDADPSVAKTWFIAASISALMAELPSGPCSLAMARHRHGIKAPPGVDGRAAGAASRRLYREDRIEPAGWFDDSPWTHCHDSPSRVWRLPTKGRQ